MDPILNFFETIAHLFAAFWFRLWSIPFHLSVWLFLGLPALAIFLVWLINHVGPFSHTRRLH
jgi:hypothetical protein